MVTYLLAHEKRIKDLLASDDKQTNWDYIQVLHDKKITYFQHERLIHLLVMLTTSIAALLSFFFTLLLDIPAFFLLTFILLILSIAYVIHYFKLENGVQRLYKLTDKIEEKRQ